MQNLQSNNYEGCIVINIFVMYSCTFSYIVTNEVIVCTKIYTVQAATSKSEYGGGFFQIHEKVEQIIVHQTQRVL